MERQPLPENKETSTKKLINGRRATEQHAVSAGELSFEALLSNSGLIADKPGVVVNDPGLIDKSTLVAGRKEDNVICAGLRRELEGKGLKPDGKTFYLIEFGLPHLPAIQSVLLDYGIDPSIYINPSKKTIDTDADHFKRYISVYKEHAERLFSKREKLDHPKGFALLLNSHAENDERAYIANILPPADLLKQKGITKLVLGVEFFYDQFSPTPNTKDPNEPFFNASEVNRYARQLGNTGIDVVVIGFDYRRRQRESMENHAFPRLNIKQENDEKR